MKKMKCVLAAITASAFCTTNILTVQNFIPQISLKAFATETENKYGDWTYNVLNDGSISIKGYNGTDGDIEIPSEINGTAVTSIEDYAFYDNDNMKSIQIPASITKIGECAFRSCNNLTSLTIPEAITTIGPAAFMGCHSMTSFDISSENKNFSVSDGILYDYTGTKLIAYPAGRQETDYTIPSYVTFLGGAAFGDCDNLVSVTVPDTVTETDGGVFLYCDNLKMVRLSNNLTEIPYLYLYRYV